MNAAELAAQFERFAQRECGTSPLYRRLAGGTAADPELLAIALTGDHGPKPNLFLASVHYLLLREAAADSGPDGTGSRAMLARFYPTLSGTEPTAGDPFPPFREYCLEHEAALRQLMSERLVQTNEVSRGAVLFAAYSWLSPRLGKRPLALIEVGASAGLLLFWDRYSYDFGDGQRHGDTASPVGIRCPLRGPLRPPAAAIRPEVRSRVGIDLNPVDVRDADVALWLRALVWGDQAERAGRLRAAIGVVTETPPRLIAGDALQVLPAVLASIPEDVLPVVFHSHTLNQFPPAARAEFDGLLASHSQAREIWRISMEWLTRPENPELEVSLYAGGARRETHTLAGYEAHGDWLEWLEA